LSSDESESDDETFLLFDTATGGGKAAFLAAGATADFDATGGLIAGSSSSESLLLEGAGFFAIC
jgi:hypothetical protein